MRNTAADGISRSRVAVILLGVWLTCPSAWALNPTLELSQYARTTWKARDGFPRGAVNAIAQTPDGFLWIGTNSGLFRFDGVNPVPWQPPGRTNTPSLNVYSLLAASDGALWISGSQGIMRWKDGALAEYDTPPGAQLWNLTQDREGRIWAGVAFPAPGRVCLVEQTLQCSDAGGQLGPGVYQLFEDSKGQLWAGLPAGVVRWTRNAPRLFPLPPQLNGYRGLVEEDGDLLVGMPEGLARFVDGKTTLVHPSPSAVRPLAASVSLRDRDGGLWMGTFGRGLVHFHDGRTETLTQADGLSGNGVTVLFEDREGNVWVGTTNGLDRFRDVAVPSYSVAQGLSNDLLSAVLATKDGSVWIGTSDGVNRWNDGRLTIYREQPRPTRTGVQEIVARGFPERSHAMLQDTAGRMWISDRRGAGYLENGRFVTIPGISTDPDGFVTTIVEDKRGDIWLATRDAFVHVRGRRVLERIPWSTFTPGGQHASTAVADPVGEGLWLGFLTGAVVRVVDGRVQAAYSAADGLGTGRVHHLRAEADGTVWASTQGGLSRLTATRTTTLDARGGLPCTDVLWSIEDDARSVWLFMSCGLVRVPRSGLDAWMANTEGPEARRPAVPFTLFGSADGIRLTSSLTAYAPQATKAPDGRIWFSTLDAVSVLDPRQLRDNPLAPPVHIEQVIADRTTFDASQDVRLPPRVRDLQVSYTALSLVTPERNRFRVMLEGRDREWQDVGTRRQVFYNDLPPGTYRFRVIASNNSGVWNEAGAALVLSIAPAYYQTTWFRVASAVAVLLGLVAAYQLRLRRLARDFNMRLDERVNERTRIARELHDTLLQTIHGSRLVADRALRDTTDRNQLVRALEQVSLWLGQAATEGRAALHTLRASTTTSNDLAAAFRRAIEESRRDSAAEMPFSVEGRARELHPIVRDEVYRIGYEAIRNACVHSRASCIEVALEYGRDLVLRIRDNGVGIDTAEIEEGKEGHFGLRGMRERAERIGATFTLVSAPGTGTAITVTVPGRKVFRSA